METEDYVSNCGQGDSIVSKPYFKQDSIERILNYAACKEFWLLLW